jgi:type II secretory pathway component PulM
MKNYGNKTILRQENFALMRQAKSPNSWQQWIQTTVVEKLDGWITL